MSWMALEDELDALQHEKFQIEMRVREIKIAIAERDGSGCDHDFQPVCGSMGDYRDPEGARCSICGHQIWY